MDYVEIKKKLLDIRTKYIIKKFQRMALREGYNVDFVFTISSYIEDIGLKEPIHNDDFWMSVSSNFRDEKLLVPKDIDKAIRVIEFTIDRIKKREGMKRKR